MLTVTCSLSVLPQSRPLKPCFARRTRFTCFAGGSVVMARFHRARGGHSSGHPQTRQDDLHQENPQDHNGDNRQEVDHVPLSPSRVASHHVDNRPLPAPFSPCTPSPPVYPLGVGSNQWGKGSASSPTRQGAHCARTRARREASGWVKCRRRLCCTPRLCSPTCRPHRRRPRRPSAFPGISGMRGYSAWQPARRRGTQSARHSPGTHTRRSASAPPVNCGIVVDTD